MKNSTKIKIEEFLHKVQRLQVKNFSKKFHFWITCHTFCFYAFEVTIFINDKNGDTISQTAFSFNVLKTQSENRKTFNDLLKHLVDNGGKI